MHTLGGYFRTRMEASSGKDKRKPASITAMRVDRTREHRAPLRNIIRSVKVTYGVMWTVPGTVHLLAVAAYAYRLDWTGEVMRQLSRAGWPGSDHL